MRKRSSYAPKPGAEHCPTCWEATGAQQRLRTELHHNGALTPVVVCDACGLFLPL